MPWQGTKPTEPIELHAALRVTMAVTELIVPMAPRPQQGAVVPTIGAVPLPETIHHPITVQEEAPEAINLRAIQFLEPVTIADLQAHQEALELTEAAEEVLPEVQVVLGVRVAVAQEAQVV